MALLSQAIMIGILSQFMLDLEVAQYRYLIPAQVDWTPASAWSYTHG